MLRRVGQRQRWTGPEGHTDPPVLAQVGHREHSHSGDMTTPADSQARAERIRRTRLVRRGVVVAGATGALGAAVAIGATIQTAGAADSGTTDDQTPGDQTQGDQGGPELRPGP